MSILKNARNRIGYIKNNKKANKLIKENQSLIDFYCLDNTVLVPFVDRKRLNENNVICDKEIECVKKISLKEPLMIYLDGMTKEQKRKMPPMFLYAKIVGPGGLNPKYAGFRENVKDDSIRTYTKKAIELGIDGRGRTLEIEYITEDYDTLDENYFKNFFKKVRMTKNDIFLSKKYFDLGFPLSYVHEINEDNKSLTEFQNSIEGINEIIWDV